MMGCSLTYALSVIHEQTLGTLKIINYILWHILRMKNAFYTNNSVNIV